MKNYRENRFSLFFLFAQFVVTFAEEDGSNNGGTDKGSDAVDG